MSAEQIPDDDGIQVDDMRAIRREGRSELRALMRAQIQIGRSRREDAPKPAAPPRPPGHRPGAWPTGPAPPARSPSGRLADRQLTAGPATGAKDPSARLGCGGPALPQHRALPRPALRLRQLPTRGDPMTERTLAQQYRARTAAELGLAGNHPDAIEKHLDAYEAAVAHELAEKQRAAADKLDAALGAKTETASTMRNTAALIDPEETR